MIVDYREWSQCLSLERESPLMEDGDCTMKRVKHKEVGDVSMGSPVDLGISFRYSVKKGLGEDEFMSDFLDAMEVEFSDEDVVIDLSGVIPSVQVSS